MCRLACRCVCSQKPRFRLRPRPWRGNHIDVAVTTRLGGRGLGPVTTLKIGGPPILRQQVKRQGREMQRRTKWKKQDVEAVGECEQPPQAVACARLDVIEQGCAMTETQNRQALAVAIDQSLLQFHQHRGRQDSRPGAEIHYARGVSPLRHRRQAMCRRYPHRHPRLPRHRQKTRVPRRQDFRWCHHSIQ